MFHVIIVEIIHENRQKPTYIGSIRGQKVGLQGPFNTHTH